jgi:hypothetical protein
MVRRPQQRGKPAQVQANKQLIVRPAPSSHTRSMACIEHAIIMQWRTFKSKMFPRMFIAGFGSVRDGAESHCGNLSWRRLVKSCPMTSSKDAFRRGPEPGFRVRRVSC